MLPMLPNYLSGHIHRCFDGLHIEVWYHLDYNYPSIANVLSYCVFFPIVYVYV